MAEASPIQGRIHAAVSDQFPLIAALLFENRRETFVGASLIAVMLYALLIIFGAINVNQLETFGGTVFGGDFVVFWTAANSVFAENLATIYGTDNFEARLADNFPGRHTFNVSWQYPPTMFLLVAPFAALPYLPALFAWWAANLVLFTAAIRTLWRDGSALLIALASAAVFQGLITGQTGLLTASLLALAAYKPAQKPLIAGLAAGVLTVKPQFGLLIPIAFAAAGCWRAFGVAAIAGASLAVFSILAFGVDIWPAWYEAVLTHGGRLQSEIFPYYKVISPYGGLMVIGAPSAVAMTLQAAFAFSLCALVFLVWRKIGDWDLRLMALCAAAPLATPYAFYYELPIFVLPLLLVAKRATETGWLPGERAGLIALWAAPLFITNFGHAWYVPYTAVLTGAAFFTTARRPFLALQDKRTDGAP
ncbi:MAG: DUF2029 domain-containing protein [Marinicaulis sp.]|nr:DUF2029 domain-containing protein [Marinicaulis sp.]